jgi:hypothetical protein
VVANILIDQLAAALPVVLKNFPTALTHGCRCAPSFSITTNNGKRYGLLKPGTATTGEELHREAKREAKVNLTFAQKYGTI